MNIFGIIILVTLLVNYLLNLVADYYNLKALKPDLPEEFDGVYDEETYRRSQEYTRVNTKFGFVSSAFNLVLILVFWFAGGFNWLDQIVRGWELGTIWTGLAYIGILILAKSILSLPFSIYSTFVIEEKFGFNKTTPKTFVLDMLKGLGLGIVLGGPLLAGILAFFTYFETYGWLYAWGAVTAFTLFVQFIAPTWIMPIFNDFEPLEDGELRKKIEDMAASVNFPLQGIFVMDGSKRSSKSNAFFTGFGKNKRIALYDTLIEKHTDEELVAVLAHEVGHYKKKHIIKNMVISILQTGVMFLLLSIFLNAGGLYDAFYMEQQSVYTGLIFFGMLYAPIDMILSIFMQIISRKHEFQADRFAAETTGQPENMVQALKKLSKDNLSNLTPHPFYVFLNYSHPPVLQRIEAVRNEKL
ncbi:M48 family metallopeptidase [Aliifodinibius sp. S!AR15-10]|uniref:M48 family metallopeptidase n=1 Tax=Aliifodinibius sp. S!AR15-10 TaxID=2950437 RepID=UPI002859224B|nr:M48 family metallopeptidase [Aliifodinibius sp. S!AR15-10]MDR8392908.1 M48 family metallopeptidase [Aliifodinibius sp. S!AR15-10]